MKDDIYAFIFGRKGLMAGVGIHGNKITKTTEPMLNGCILRDEAGFAHAE
jgi:lipid-binding SYLF domain-containing protein